MSTIEDAWQAVTTIVADTALDDLQSLFRSGIRIAGALNPLARQAIKSSNTQSKWLPSDSYAELGGDTLTLASYVIPGGIALKGAKAGVSAGKTALSAAKLTVGTRKAVKASTKLYRQGKRTQAAKQAMYATNRRAAATAAKSRSNAYAARAYKSGVHASIANTPNTIDDVITGSNYAKQYDRTTDESYTAYRRRKQYDKR